MLIAFIFGLSTNVSSLVMTLIFFLLGSKFGICRICRNDLVEMWTTIKNDRQRHLQMLRQKLEKEAKQEKLSK